MTTYLIKLIGSGPTGWAIIRDGVIWTSHPSPLYLGAYLDATLRGAEPNEAELIAQAIISRPEPSYEERLRHHETTGPWKPAPDPYKPTVEEVERQIPVTLGMLEAGVEVLAGSAEVEAEDLVSRIYRAMAARA